MVFSNLSMYLFYIKMYMVICMCNAIQKFRLYIFSLIIKLFKYHELEVKIIITYKLNLLKSDIFCHKIFYIYICSRIRVFSKQIAFLFEIIVYLINNYLHWSILNEYIARLSALSHWSHLNLDILWESSLAVLIYTLECGICDNKFGKADDKKGLSIDFSFNKMTFFFILIQECKPFVWIVLMLYLMLLSHLQQSRRLQDIRITIRWWQRKRR